MKYRLILKDGQVKIELMDCSGPICDVNAEKIREFLSLAAPAETEYKPEYGQTLEAETLVTAEAH
jgi:hypothetical protein